MCEKRDFFIENSSLIWESSYSHDITEKGNLSEFDLLIQSSWKKAEHYEALNYNCDDVFTKILPGKFKIVAQVKPSTC